MYGVIRRYSNGATLADEFAKRPQEIIDAIRTPSCVAYYSIREGEVLTTVTICANRAEAEETNHRAAAWVRENVPELSTSVPEVTEGEVIVEFS